MESLKASAETVVEKAKETAEYLKPKLEAAYETAKPVAEKIFNEYPLFLLHSPSAPYPPPPSLTPVPQEFKQIDFILAT